MSDTDSFIEEVNEEVRREKLYGYVRQYGWVAIIAVLGVVGVTGFIEYQKAATAGAAQQLGDRVIKAVAVDDLPGRAKALAEIAPEAGNAMVIVNMRRAGELVEAGDTDGAIAVFEGIAESDAPPIYADMARLKTLILRGEGQNAAERDTALAKLAAPGALYRPLALEQQGLVALNAGKRDKAIGIFMALLQDSEITDGLRNRTTQTLIALGADIPEVSSLLQN